MRQTPIVDVEVHSLFRRDHERGQTAPASSTIVAPAIALA
jgi:hypothetical protein